MIEFIPRQAEAVPAHKNCYEMVLNFMEGDADGSQRETFFIPAAKHQDELFRAYLADFVKTYMECVELDSHGRGGFDDTLECAKHYRKVKNWSKYCVSPVECLEACDFEAWDLTPFMEIEDGNDFAYTLPNHNDGWYCSYKPLQIFYYDQDGVKYRCDIKLGNL